MHAQRFLYATLSSVLLSLLFQSDDDQEAVPLLYVMLMQFSIPFVCLYLAVGYQYIEICFRRKKKCIRFMTGDPDADEQTDKEEDDDDDDDADNNNSMSASGVGAAGSESDDSSSQNGYGSECGTTSSSVSHEPPSTNRITAPSTSNTTNSMHKHSIGGILGNECSTSRINSAQQSSSFTSSHSTSQRDNDSGIPASKPIIHAT